MSEMKMIRRFAAVLALCAVSTVAAPSEAQEPQHEEDIVVVGERLQEMVRSFVGEVAVAPSGEQQMARWDGRICPLVAGLPARQMQYVADRIAQRAHQVDIRTDVEALVRALADKDPLVRADAAVSLGALGPMAAQAVPALREAAGDAHAGVRARAKAALAAIGADRT
jgi:hypothetical protein